MILIGVSILAHDLFIAGNAPKRFTVALQSFSSEPLLTANIPKKRLDLNEDRMGAKKASQARLDVKDCTWESFLDALLQALKSPSDKDSSEVHSYLFK